MKGLIFFLIVGAAMLMLCSAQVEVGRLLFKCPIRNYKYFTQAQQLDGDLPQDAFEEGGVDADGQKTIIQVSKTQYC